MIKPYRNGALHWHMGWMGFQDLGIGGRFMHFGRRDHQDYMKYFVVDDVDDESIKFSGNDKEVVMPHMEFLKEFQPSVVRKGVV